MFLLLKMTKGVVDMKEKIFSVLMQTSGAIFGESPIEEPYSYVEKGSFSGEEQPASPDPLVTYRWEKPMADDVLEIFLRGGRFPSGAAAGKFQWTEYADG